jgi:hypothetical protein
VFENRVLRRVFGPKRDEVTGEWRKLHNEELNNLYLRTTLTIQNWMHEEIKEQTAVTECLLSFDK